MNLDIWAFVRVMVALEEQMNDKQASGEAPAALYQLWEQEWLEVDQQLAELADTDFGAYSEMMMSTQIALDLPDAHRATFEKTIKGLVSQLKQKRASSKDPEFQKDLKFEIEGLSALLRA